MVAAGVVCGEGVEDGGEDGDGQSRAKLGRGGDGLSEIGADAREEHIRVGSLVNEVDKQVVGGSDLYSTLSAYVSQFLFLDSFFLFIFQDFSNDAGPIFNE